MGILKALQKEQLVWEKGRPIPDWDPAIWRWDDHGTVMKRSEYGNRNSEHGWEIDHHPVPAALGGSDDISNLRPLNWRNNASAGADIAEIKRTIDSR